MSRFFQESICPFDNNNSGRDNAGTPETPLLEETGETHTVVYTVIVVGVVIFFIFGLIKFVRSLVTMQKCRFSEHDLIPVQI